MNITWSSYLAYVGKVKPPQWLYRDETYGQLQVRRGRAQKYRRFVEAGEENDPLAPFYNKRRGVPILGDDAFIQNVRQHVDEVANEVTKHDAEQLRPSIEQIVAEVAKQFGVAETGLYQMRRGRGQKNTPRKIAMFIARNKGGQTLVTIAKAFGLTHYGGVSNAIYSVTMTMQEDKALAKSINHILKRLDP